MTTFKTMLLAGLASSALAVSTAHAQDLPPSNADGAKSSVDDASTVVVTGSRIARPELKSAMPVSVTKFDDVARLGRLDAYDALRLDPSIAPGAGAYSADFYDGTGDAGNAGAAFVNLRNMGTNRSLTLIDGMRRVSGTAAASAVDINMIPSAMIDRIEVVTGGAAAIYGADAVTGAVNIITKKDLKGLNITAYQGISQYGDAPETNVSMATGGKFADGRGSFSLGMTYIKTGAVEEHDRDFSRNNIVYWANPKNTGVNDGIPDNIVVKNLLLFYNSEVPEFFNPSNNGYYHYYNGQLTQDTYNFPLGTGETARGDGTSNPAVVRSYNWYAPLRLSEKTFSTIAKFDYELTDDIKYAAQFDYGRTISGGLVTRYREDSRTLFAGGNGGAKAFPDNPYMPDSVRSLLASSGLDYFSIDRWYTNWPLVETTNDRESLTLSQNLSGKIGSSLNWEAFYQYGRATDDTTVSNVPLTSRWVAARDVIADPMTGAPVCRDPAARAAGCVPYNIFGNAPLTAAQKAWMLTNLHSGSVNKQQIFGANVNGKLFALPGGDVSFAAGVERRTESGRLIVDPQVASGEVPLSGFVASIPTVPVNASTSVTEAYGELVVPIIKDKPFLHRVELEGAYRYSDYKTIGSTNTWKVGGTWEPISGLTIRGVRSRSVRVPNFGELYAPVSEGFTGSINDPCLAGNYNLTPTRAANCQALGVPNNLAFYSTDVLVRSGGNPDLKPETSDSFTLGAVLQPHFIRGLDITIDYWDIKIKNVITSFSINDMMNQCVDLPTTDNPFCPYVQRGADHKINFISTQLVNAALQKASGIDFGVNYRTPLWKGQVNLGFKGSYLLQREVQNIPGVEQSILKYAGGYTDPRFRGYLLIDYNTDHYSLSVGTQFTSAAMEDPNAIPDQYDNNHIPAMVYNDVSLSRRFDNRFEITLGIKNILNTQPPLMPNVYDGGGGRYDTIGRYFFTRVGVKF
jgi:outer membrane receptor protein involved in Fe transport